MGTESISMASVLENIAEHDTSYNPKNRSHVDFSTFGVDRPDSELDAEIGKFERRVEEQRAQLEIVCMVHVNISTVSNPM
jgi:hypothetical protein